MPRLVLKEGVERRRVNIACDSCRKRKEKCDSQQPCAGCVKRGIDCVFAANPATTESKSKAAVEQHISVFDSRGPELDPVKAESHVSRRWSSGEDLSKMDQPAMSSPLKPRFDQTTEAPVPRMPRLLRDQNGSIVYSGDSAGLSFLEHVRHIVASAVGECKLVTEPLCCSFLDSPSGHGGSSPTHRQPHHGMFDSTGLMLSQEQVNILANQYLAATATLLDLFHKPTLFRTLRVWVCENSVVQLDRPVVYLVMAVGARTAAGHDWDEVADRCFAAGRQLANDSLTSEPCVQTVQAFVLITMYMLSTGRHNAAFVSLGTATSSAFALGLHRGDLNRMFSDPERQSRERVWRSLRVLDLFLSTSLGRPCATSNYEDHSHANILLDDLDTSDPMPSAIMGLCTILQRILNDVYNQETLSTQVADDVTQVYREWSLRLPKVFGNNFNTDNAAGSTPLDVQDQVAAAHLMGAYHWSIILLTRPFLLFCVAERAQLVHGDVHASVGNINTASGSSITTYAEFGIDSALRGLEIAAGLLRQQSSPGILPFVANSIFNSALAVGVAVFGDFDHSYPLVDAITRAELMLSQLGAYDPQARKYERPVTLLKNAVATYIQRRDRTSTESRRMRKNSTFGIIGLDSTTSFSNPIPPFGSAFAGHRPFNSIRGQGYDRNPTEFIPYVPQIPATFAGHQEAMSDFGSEMPGFLPTPAASNGENFEEETMFEQQQAFSVPTDPEDMMTEEMFASLANALGPDIDLSTEQDMLPTYDPFAEPGPFS